MLDYNLTLRKYCEIQLLCRSVMTLSKIQWRSFFAKIVNGFFFLPLLTLEKPLKAPKNWLLSEVFKRYKITPLTISTKNITQRYLIVSYIHHYCGCSLGAEGVMDYNNLLMKLNSNFNLNKQVLSVTNEAISFEQVRVLSQA